MADKIDYKKINYGIALLKMLLAFEVILEHCIEWDNYDPRLIWPFRELVSVTVTGFVILSFYFVAKLFLKRDKELMRKRLFRLLIPQIGWAFIYYITYALIDLFMHKGLHSGPMDLFWQLFTGHSRYLNPSMWYQINIIIITIIFYYIFKLFDDKKAIIVLFITSMFCYYAQFSGLNYSLFGNLEFELKFPLGRLMEVFPVATIGFYLRYFNILEKLKKYRYIIMPLCIVLFMFGFYIPWPTPKDFGFGSFAKLYLTLCVLVFAYLTPLENIKLKYKKAILKISSYSLGIYCAHRLVNTLLLVFLPKIPSGTFERCVLLYALNYALSYFIDLIPNKYTKALVE